LRLRKVLVEPKEASPAPSSLDETDVGSGPKVFASSSSFSYAWWLALSWSFFVVWAWLCWSTLSVACGSVANYFSLWRALPPRGGRASEDGLVMEACRSSQPRTLPPSEQARHGGRWQGGVRFFSSDSEHASAG